MTGWESLTGKGGMVAYERIPLQARLNSTEDKAFTEEAKRHDMTRAGLCRWLVATYLSDTATGRKLRTADKRSVPAEKAPKASKARAPRKVTDPTLRATRRKPKPKVTVTAGRCRHGNLGLCLQCAQARAAAEI